MEIELPDTRQGLSDLSKGIKTKVLADGIGGELHAFNIAQGIDVTADFDNSVLSVAAEKNHFIKFRLGEKNNEIFHKTLDFTNTVSRGIAQELKGLNAPNFKNGNDWGFDFSDHGKVNFPTEIADQITLFQNINIHYLTFAAGTAPIEPLLVAKGWVMADIATALAGAIIIKAAADQAHRDAKTYTQDANSYMATPEINIHKIADFLQSRHQNDGRVLGDYTFNTSDAPALEKAQLSSILASTNKQLQHIVIGSVMTSMVNFPLTVHKGTSLNQPAEILPAFGELAMGKGHNQCIVVNPNALLKGIVKVIVKK